MWLLPSASINPFSLKHNGKWLPPNPNGFWLGLRKLKKSSGVLIGAQNNSIVKSFLLVDKVYGTLRTERANDTVVHKNDLYSSYEGQCLATVKDNSQKVTLCPGVTICG